MNKEFKSSFDGLVRARKKQIKWLNENKHLEDCKTIAGYLDIIINKHKNNK